jgi:L-threonylcarbamoyladenylate synthase
MRTEVLHLDPHEPDRALVRRAAEVLRGGGLVAFPTETVYGLGADARNAAAADRIFTAKGRPARNPLIVHVATAEAARELAAYWPEAAQLLAERFWPGPLTLVVPRGRTIPDVVTAGGPTVALRAPAHPVARALLEEADFPVAAPSANPSAGLSPTRAEHVLRGLGGRIELILDAGPTPGGLESTVLDLTAVPPRLLRPGLVSPAELEAVLGPLGEAAGPPADLDTTPLPSPGRMRRHYAPRTPLECTPDNDWARVEELVRQGLRVGWVTFPEHAGQAGPQVVVVTLPRDPAAYAARLYAALHDLDDAGVNRIVVTLPPATEEWLAIRDRLERAATELEKA